MRLSEVPAFSRIRITDFGSFEQIEGVPSSIDEVVTVWTHEEHEDDIFGTVKVRGLIDSSASLVWFPSDATVEVVEEPRYAGRPEDLVKQAVPVKAPAGSRGLVKTRDGWRTLIWDSDLVHSPIQGWNDVEIAVEILLCAIAVAPSNGDPNLRPMLLAGLKARYLDLRSDPETYPPDRYP